MLNFANKRKLGPNDAARYFPMEFPAPITIADLTQEESESFAQKFLRMTIKNELDSQAKMIKRARPHAPRTPREMQLAQFLPKS
jgi:hypothetical protein